MSPRSELEGLSGDDLLNALVSQIYDPPLASVRERLPEVAEALRVTILVSDFDIEVNMNGILGFLENSTGLYLAETIEAFEKIRAPATAAVLRDIEKTMRRHGVTPAMLRSDFANVKPYEITSFQKLHGDLGSMPEEITADAQRLYVYDSCGDGEDVGSLLTEFVDLNRTALLAEVERITGDA